MPLLRAELSELGLDVIVAAADTYRAFVDVALRDAINAGWTPGPRMMVAGAYVSCTGGGGDISGLAPDAAPLVMVSTPRS